jgi:hypothetical protein
MRTFGFLSRHKTTDQQKWIAEKQGINIVDLGDINAFHVDYRDVQQLWSDYCIGHDETKTIGELESWIENGLQGVIVVHPAAALNLITETTVGVWENEKRASSDGKPMLVPKHLHIYD